MKSFLIIYLLFCTALVAAAQGCTKGDCTDGDGVYVYSDGSKYVGEFKDGKANGFGICYYADGRTYVGEFNNHSTSGHGAWTYADGSITTGFLNGSGEFVDIKTVTPGCLKGDCQNGQGTKLWDEGVEYVGSFKSGVCDGYGICYFNDGSKYEGEWKNHKFDGSGTYYHADGTIERGYFKEHKYLGENQKQNGCLEGDCENGVGMYRFSEGGTYSGEFKDGEINGQGTYFFPDGGKYVGGWLNTKFEGQGTYTSASGEIQSGIWHDEILMSETQTERLTALVNWEQPVSTETQITYTTFELKACIQSGSAVKKLTVSLNGKTVYTLSDLPSNQVGSCTISFSHTVDLVPGKNRVTLSVENDGGWNDSPDRIIERVTSGQQKRLALVIGNSDYIYGNKLKNPVNDADAIAARLEGLGFKVIKAENTSLRDLKMAIDNFGKSLEGYDVGLFYYAGHGIQLKGLNYLVPVDANIQSEAQVEYDCVLADRVLSYMELAKADVNIIILDACRNNPFQRSWNRSTESGGLAFMNAPAGTLIAYSTGPNHTASDGNGNNGLYTQALLEEVADPNLTILQIFQRVRAKVAERSATNQIPWESTSLTGDFYFVKTQ